MDVASSPLERLAAKLETRWPFSDEDRQALLSLPHATKTMHAGQYLVRDGDAPNCCWLLLSGFAQRFVLLADGSRQIVGIHLAGDLVDLHFSMLRPASHNVQLLTPARVATIPVTAVANLMRVRPAVAEAIWIDTLADASIFQEWIVSVGRRNARAALAHLLCELGTRVEQAGLGSRTGFVIPLSQEQIGDALGLTPVHVNRMLRQLEREGLIRRERRLVAIPDWDRLAALGEFTSSYLHLPA